PSARSWGSSSALPRWPEGWYAACCAPPREPVRPPTSSPARRAAPACHALAQHLAPPATSERRRTDCPLRANAACPVPDTERARLLVTPVPIVKVGCHYLRLMVGG